MRCRLAARKIQDADAAAILLELQDSTGHAQLGVVWMRSDDQNVEHGGEIRGQRSGVRNDSSGIHPARLACRFTYSLPNSAARFLSPYSETNFVTSQAPF